MIRPKKSLGQNFLMHARTAERIVAAAALPPHSTVLEIGPGTGMLTAPLLAAATRVVAVETDGDLIPALRTRFSAECESGRLTLVQGDIRAFDLESVSAAGSFHVVANIPYYITGDILRHLLSAPHKPTSMTLLVQKEVAERIARARGKESLLSVSVGVYGTPRYCFTVPRGAFRPAPTVDSAVLSITDIKMQAFTDRAEEQAFFAIVRAAFAHKRKQLGKNLESILDPSFVSAVLARANIDPRARAEQISIAGWRAVVEAAHSLNAYPSKH
jgi:16S rRNA (adenine1518-N6/adenine1519-N6)-dimethyltransferase